MPELPDVTVYVEALKRRIVGERLEIVRIQAPFLLRTVDPPLDSVRGKEVRDVRRLGKRIAVGLDEELWLVLHLMIAGRLHWTKRGAKLSGKSALAAFDFSSGTVLLTEAGSKRRAALHLVRGRESLDAHDPGGLEVLQATRERFHAVLRSRNHTLKRALTDPRLFSGIGNAYSDEVLHRARLSPLALTQKLSTDEVERLYMATREVLSEWVERLRAETGEDFPEHVTAFRPGMAVHGRFEEPCPVCGAPVQRIRYADNETNYCPRCQTGGRILADRSLSRLLKEDWPRSLEELEEASWNRPHAGSRHRAHNDPPGGDARAVPPDGESITR
jgi:formamidopyrimidine-DNA glycosylase